MTDSKVTFSWKNYTKATPRNLEYIAASARRIVAVAAGLTIIMDANKWIPAAVVVVGALLDELKNFFAHVAEGDREVVSVSYPESVADQVNVKTEIKSGEKEGGT